MLARKYISATFHQDSNYSAESVRTYIKYQNTHLLTVNQHLITNAGMYIHQCHYLQFTYSKLELFSRVGAYLSKVPDYTYFKTKTSLQYGHVCTLVVSPSVTSTVCTDSKLKQINRVGSYVRSVPVYTSFKMKTIRQSWHVCT